ncbi:MAG TPA: HD domain-containing phosphohydrolase [Pyrinomonadaceae bacterium]|jgi:response regulator RpfG family c-di-GMP phosphodiesterase
MSYKIMIVDDEMANLRLLERLFGRDYQVISAASGSEALELLQQHDVSLMITDQRMPGMTGIELLKQTAPLRPHMVRILLTGYTDVNALVEAINCGQVYKYITKPWTNEDLRLTVSRALEHYEMSKSRHELALTNQRLVLRMTEMAHEFMRAIADGLEAKDEYIHGHARRVSGYATAIGKHMGLEAALLKQLSMGAFLHDIGKIGTPDHILLKTEPLTAEEQSIVRLHAKRGARMLTGIVDMEEAAQAVLHHHEHYDGTGYPEGLRGEQIPLLSRIILVADAYDAMTNPRPFREARDHDAALAQLTEGCRTRFDPEVVRAFSELETIALIRCSIAAGMSSDCLPGSPIAPDQNRLTLNDLICHVENTPALAAYVLRESKLASGISTASLQTACTRLGEERLRELVVDRNGNTAMCSHDELLWEHSLRCAEAARLLAEETAIMSPEDAYTLGLLHDTGEALLRSLFPSEIEQLRGLSEGERMEREIAIFGVDHAQVGQWALESCGIPRALTVAVQTHHDVIRTNTPAALLLHLANAIAQADDPYKIAGLDSIGTDRLYMLRLNHNSIFRIHATISSFIEQKLDPIC